MLHKKIDIIVREMEICQDINMHVGCNLASSIYPSASQRILVHRQYVEGLPKNKLPSCLLPQNFDGARCIVGYVFWSMFVLSFTTRYVVVINTVFKVI